jgi:hypothetical protein
MNDQWCFLRDPSSLDAFSKASIEDISGSPCPFAAFGTVIVNHTDSANGKLICMGINENRKTGNPTLHGKS